MKYRLVLGCLALVMSSAALAQYSNYGRTDVFGNEQPTDWRWQYGQTSQYGQGSYGMRSHMYRSMNAGEHDIYTAMRRLWSDHVAYTRMFIVSAANGSPDKDATTARLLRNQVDIGNAIKPFYGNNAGNRLTQLLTDHILIAASIVTAGKANDMARLTSERGRWFANADEIAHFLANANPRNWPYPTVRQMMNDHLNITLDEAVAELHGDYPTSVSKYDQAQSEILMMADSLSVGIINQFPGRVR